MFPFWIDYSSCSFWEFAPWLVGFVTWFSFVLSGR